MSFNAIRIEGSPLEAFTNKLQGLKKARGKEASIKIDPDRAWMEPIPKHQSLSALGRFLDGLPNSLLYSFPPREQIYRQTDLD